MLIFRYAFVCAGLCPLLECDSETDLRAGDDVSLGYDVISPGTQATESDRSLGVENF